MIRFETRLAVVAGLLATLSPLAAATAQRIPSDVLSPALEEEVARIRKLPKADAARRLPVVLYAVDRLKAAGHAKVALGLARWITKTDPHYAEGQLTFAELSVAAKRGSDAKRAAKQVLETGLDDRARAGAARILEETVDASLAPLERVEADGPALVLVAMGDVDVLLLKAVRERMQRWVHMPVLVQGGGIRLPMSERNPWLEELDRCRRALEGEWNGGGSALAERLGVGREELQRDEVLVRVYREWLASRDDWRALSDFEAGVRDAHRPVWIAGNLTQELAMHIGEVARDGVRYLGVTRGDMINPRSHRAVLGWGGENLGVISYAQFLPDIRKEKPSWDKLVERLTKQAFCTAAEVLQLGRCRDRSCPLNLGRRPTFKSFDQKRPGPCPSCELKLQLAK